MRAQKGRDPLDDDTAADARRLVSRSRAGRNAPVLGRRTWTEHRSPAPEAAAPAAPEPPDEPAAPADPDHVGSHRAPEPEPLSSPISPPPRCRASGPPSPRRSCAIGLTSEPEPSPSRRLTPSRRPTRHPNRLPSRPTPPPLPLTEQPTTKVPLRDWTSEAPQEPPAETVPYADATTSTPPEPPAVEPPAGTEPRVPVDNRKLVMGFGGAVAALLLVLVLAAVYAFVIHKPDTVDASSPTTETTTITTEGAHVGGEQRLGVAATAGRCRRRPADILGRRRRARQPPSPTRRTSSSPRMRRASSSSCA